MKNDLSAAAKKVDRISQTYGFYREGGKTLVGFSGGADSVCLLHFLLTRLGAERLVTVHVHHGLRGAEADRDEAFCRDFCAVRGIPFIARHVDIAAISGGVGIEEAARDARYAILTEEARRADCATISLAHTASDNLETVIFNLCRGAGLDGISGIPPMRPVDRNGDPLYIVRPLIDCTREDILAYLQENALPYVTDSTNANVHYTRNFIRHEIIPKLKAINPQTEENARQTAEIAADAAAFLEGQADDFLARGGSDTEANATELDALPPALFYAVLRAMYHAAGGGALSSTQAEAVKHLLSAHKKGHSISLSGEIIARYDGDKLCLTPADADTPEALPSPQALHIGENHIGAHICIYIGTEPPTDMENCRFSAWANLPATSLATLHARARRDGEKYRSGGMTRSLKKLLCGAERQAKCRPLICDGSGILWLPGFAPADRSRTGDTVKIYYLEY